ncbi:MAG: FAD-dependent oxidoreductase, partial [Candidatus Sericytochromatia bacterium]
MKKVIIIGSGISGLIFARELKKVGINPIIIDKGFSVGGRIASRPFNDSFFDHGAQYFTSKSNYFENLVQELLENNIVKILDEENGKKKYIGINGMNSITQYLSKDLNISQKECVIKISYEKDKWILETDKNNNFETKSIILTAPVPQSILLSESGNFKIPLDLKTELEKVKYSRCIALIGKFKNPLLISKFDNHKSYKKIDNDNVISWVS